jgi:hypothetical protein
MSKTYRKRDPYIEGPPRKPTKSRAELRAERSAQKKRLIHAGAVGLKREVVVMHDGKGQILYDRDNGASRITSNLSSLDVFLFGTESAHAFRRQFGSADAEARLQSAAESLPSTLDATIGGIELGDRSIGQVGNRFVMLEFDSDSLRTLSEERKTILSALGAHAGYLACNVPVFITPEHGRAQRVRDEMAEHIAFPVAVTLDRAETHEFHAT